MKDLTEAIHETCRALAGMAEADRNLAAAYCATGQERMADSMLNRSQCLDELAQQLEATLGQTLNEQFMESVRGSASILSTLAKACAEERLPK